MARRLLMGLLLFLLAAAALFLAGYLGLDKKIGAPGLDAIASRACEMMTGVDRPGSPAETTLPWNIQEIVGTWSGVSDVDGTAWEFVFESNFAVRMSSSSGYASQGTAFVHWKRGLTDGALRVPPGWSPIDVDIVDSTEQAHRNTSALGAFSLRGKVLHYCFGEPGRTVRPINNQSREGIRCFALERSGPGRQKQNAGTAGRQGAPAPTGTGARDVRFVRGKEDQGLTGAAEIVINSVREEWPLRTDPLSTTDIANPQRMTLQFQAHGARFPAARRIELTLNAAKQGRHRADGQLYLENRFIRERVPVGSSPRGEPEAVLLYISETGEIFPPLSSCAVIVMMPHRGQADFLVEGHVEKCLLASAGTTVEVESISFRVQKGVR